MNQVLRDQGLGKFCEPEFIRAAAREMQEAMDMTEEEFDAAAYQLLEAEREGTLRHPIEPSTPSLAGEEDPPPDLTEATSMEPEYVDQTEPSDEPLDLTWKVKPNEETKES